MQQEIEKMSDEELIKSISYCKCDVCKIEYAELLKRLKNNSVEEFKNRINAYMRKHQKIVLTNTEINFFASFEDLTVEELNKIEHNK